MINQSNTNWLEANQQYLMAALKVVEGELVEYRHSIDNGFKKWTKQENTKTHKKLKETSDNLPAKAALNVITDVFMLSEFEKKVLLLCTGVELDSKFAELLASVQGGPMGFLPTFSLALAAFNDAHWSALSPEGRLRYWRLIELDTQQPITISPLQIDERILHFLTGTNHMDGRLSWIVRPCFNNVSLVSSHKKLAKEIVNAMSRKSQNTLPPVILLEGIDSNEKQAIASFASNQIGLNLKIMPGFAIPNSLKEISDLQRIWNRESALGASALFIDSDEMNSTDLSRFQQIISFCENIHGPLFIGSRQWYPRFKRPKIIFEVNKPTKAEQLKLWKDSFKDQKEVKNDQLIKLSSQFNLSTSTIKYLSSEVLERNGSPKSKKKIFGTEINTILWRKACSHARPRLDDLAQRILPSATWDELILPDFQKETLKEMVMHVRLQSKVYGEWGFETKGSRGLGISALFAGESGTGKTMASEVIAGELDLDLYKIDLSQVVNKYIGETEKNLKRIFDAAAEGGAILLFDEADALFGKRSEVKDSHDRYANIEVSYLLQRMEDYRGLAILTTNMKEALDQAFLRRLRFIIQFPFPDREQREEIWMGIFPSKTPSRDLDYKKLAGLSLVGGNIRNIALNAAFIAADQGDKISMQHILQATKSEYVKMEKSMSTSESGRW